MTLQCQRRSGIAGGMEGGDVQRRRKGGKEIVSLLQQHPQIRETGILTFRSPSLMPWSFTTLVLCDEAPKNTPFKKSAFYTSQPSDWIHSWTIHLRSDLTCALQLRHELFRQQVLAEILPIPVLFLSLPLTVTILHWWNTIAVILKKLGATEVTRSGCISYEEILQTLLRTSSSWLSIASSSIE